MGNDTNSINKSMKFSGTIDCSTSFTVEDLTDEEISGILKFYSALKKSGCCYTDAKLEILQVIEVI